MTDPNKTKTLAQSLVAVGVVTTLAGVVAVTWGTQWVYRSFRDAFDGAWDDTFPEDDENDKVDPSMWREMQGPIAR